MDIVMIALYIIVFGFIIVLSVQTIKYTIMMWKFKNTLKKDRKDTFKYFD